MDIYTVQRGHLCFSVTHLQQKNRRRQGGRDRGKEREKLEEEEEKALKLSDQFQTSPNIQLSFLSSLPCKFTALSWSINQSIWRKCTFYSYPVSGKTFQSSHLIPPCAQETFTIIITRVNEKCRNHSNEPRLCCHFGADRFWPNLHWWRMWAIGEVA